MALMGMWIRSSELDSCLTTDERARGALCGPAMSGLRGGCKAGTTGS
jgi:hypothetical protein